MSKFHINPRGVASSCRAEVGNCPYAKEDEHFASKEDAQAAYEAIHAAEVFAVVKKDQVKVAFHGSANLFDEFSYSTLGRSGTDHGWGFYFTDNKDLIIHYAGDAGFVYDIDFHPSKPIRSDKLTITAEDYANFIEIADKKTDGEFLENWGDVQYEGREVLQKRILKEMFYQDEDANDVDAIESLLNTEESISKEVYGYLYEKYGYDSIPVKEDKGWKDGQIYVATVPEAFSIRGISRAKDPDENILKFGLTDCKDHKWKSTLEKISDPKFTYRKCSDCERVEKVPKKI